jgi:hypothetical protein
LVERSKRRPFGTIEGLFPLVSLCGVKEELKGLDLRGGVAISEHGGKIDREIAGK